MQQDPDTVRGFLATVHPYDALPVDTLEALMPAFRVVPVAAGQPVYTVGEPLEGLCLIRSGSVAVHDANGAQVSQLGPRNSFGERGLMQDGIAVTSAHALEDSQLLILPRAEFLRLIETEPAAARFFDHQRSPRPRRAELATSRVETLMARDPLTCAPDTTVRDVARMMANRHVSSICVIEDDRLIGIATIRDLSGKVVAGALPFDTPIRDVMTTEPLSLPPSAIGSDVLHMMIERRIGHVPVTRNGRLTGIVTQTDLTRYQAHSPAELVAGIADAPDAKAMARVTARIPQLLAQLVAGGTRHEVTTRLITDIADAVTRRLLRLAEDRLGPPPVPYLWLACGSQGRQEQTGVSDQDNCLILDDTASLEHDAYFAALARVVCDGLNTCGYIYCPGDMMATTARWRQPLHVWQQYFRSWIDSPAPKAQMLASVMFDLRPIGGDDRLFGDLQRNTLAAAAQNSIFVAHMVSSALKHTPPLGLLRGFATIRSGEHRNRLDLKHNGVVPVVDLGRLYALRGRLAAVNTRARIEAATEAGIVSAVGGKDLLNAYDLVAETRLNHQEAQARADERPDNFLALTELSDFERSHLRNAFVVIKSMQSAATQGSGLPG